MKKPFATHFSLLILLFLLLTIVSGGHDPVYASASPLSLSVETAWLSGRASGNEVEQITVRYDAVLKPDVVYGSYDPLQEALYDMNGTESVKAQSYLDWYLDLFQVYMDDYGYASDFVPCSYYDTALIKRADSAVTSILYQTEAYAGGAHPNTFHTAYNFRSSDGSLLSLTDVFPDTEQLRMALYGQLSLCYPSLDLTPLDDYAMEDLTWVLDGDGLTIYLGEYVIGSLYDGFQTAHFPYDTYSSYFADWIQDASPYQGTELGNYEQIWRDLDDSGVPEDICVGMNTGEGTTAEQSRYLSIYYNDSFVYTGLPACQDLFATLLNHGGSTYLYIEASQDMDLAWTGTYRLDPDAGGSIVYIGSDLPEGAMIYTSHIMIQYPVNVYNREWAYSDVYTEDDDDENNRLYGYDEHDGTTARSAFYGVWISASKDLDASWALADLIQADGVMGWVFDSSEWSNLNPDPWYLVSAGVYYSYEDALAGLNRIQEAGYTDAYIKYSGDPVLSY